MEEINDLVGYNNLKIYQNNDWFKFSIEAILLPHFININYDTKEILDISPTLGKFSFNLV